MSRCAPNEWMKWKHSVMERDGSRVAWKRDKRLRKVRQIHDDDQLCTFRNKIPFFDELCALVNSILLHVWTSNERSVVTCCIFQHQINLVYCEDNSQVSDGFILTWLPSPSISHRIVCRNVDSRTTFKLQLNRSSFVLNETKLDYQKLTTVSVRCSQEIQKFSHCKIDSHTKAQWSIVNGNKLPVCCPLSISIEFSNDFFP